MLFMKLTKPREPSKMPNPMINSVIIPADASSVNPVEELGSPRIGFVNMNTSFGNELPIEAGGRFLCFIVAEDSEDYYISIVQCNPQLLS